MLRALLLIAAVCLASAASILWLAFHLSHDGRDVPDLINVGMVLGVIGICCTGSLVWIWIRGLIMKTGVVRTLTRMSRGDS